MKKTQNAIIVYHEDSDQSENEVSTHPSPANSADLEKKIEKPTRKLSKPKDTSDAHATTNAILNLNLNAFFNDKRKWDDSFTVAEKQASLGNIVKAASKFLNLRYIALRI
jgi:hypothetical protein